MFWQSLMELISSSSILLTCLTAIRSIEDPTLDGKLYHTFEMGQDQEGFRVFDKANSGLVFESFYYLDVEAAPAILIVASDASFQGHMVQHPLYCESVLNLICK